jgi:hypothetical protein
MSADINPYRQAAGVAESLAATKARALARIAARELQVAATGRVNGTSTSDTKDSQAGGQDGNNGAAIIVVAADARYLIVKLNADNRKLERQLLSACRSTEQEARSAGATVKEVS